ncbi:MAG: hypothetical protein QME94_19220, partial [Anaerolineae bacterium]|nr:hypothetical protein [Anaerolineae bacterium]
MDLRDALERNLRIQEDRLTLLQDRINAQFAEVMDSQQRTIGEQAAGLRGALEEIARQAASLLAEIGEQRSAFEDETAWLRKSVLRRPRSVGDAYRLATAAYADGRPNEAIQILELIVDPDSDLHGTSE